MFRKMIESLALILCFRLVVATWLKLFKVWQGNPTWLIIISNMYKIKAVLLSRIPQWDLCGLQWGYRLWGLWANPLQKYKELDLVDVCFEWIISRAHGYFAFFWRLLRAILQFLQACESNCSMGLLFFDRRTARRKPYVNSSWILFKLEAVIYADIMLSQMF